MKQNQKTQKKLYETGKILNINIQKQSSCNWILNQLRTKKADILEKSIMDKVRMDQFVMASVDGNNSCYASFFNQPLYDNHLVKEIANYLPRYA